MARIQQSVDIKVPPQVAYSQLIRFEDYPRFMDEVESAEQVDDTHVRWTTRIGEHTHDWQSEVVDRKPDQLIEWRNVEGPVSTGRFEVQAQGADNVRVSFTIDSEATTAGDAADALSRQVEANLQRLKQMLEGAGAAAGGGAQPQPSEPARQSSEGYGDVGTSDKAAPTN